MIKFQLSKLSISIDFSFATMLSIFFLLDKNGYGLLAFLACVMHEIGHIIVMIIKRNPPYEICFYGGGIKILSHDDNSWTAIFAGCLTNFILMFVFLLCGNNEIVPTLFGIMNGFVGFFNLLPIDMLDGKKLLSKLLIKQFSAEKAMRLEDKIEKVFAVAITLGVIILVLDGKINFTILLVYAYVFVVDTITNRWRKRCIKKN